MIFITGDVHSQKTEKSKINPVESQIKAAHKYLGILKKYNLKSTLFINGICFKEEKEETKKLLDYDVELGGHTYNNFGKMNIFKSYIYRKLFGCIYGPAFYQKRDIKKTKKVFENFGLKMTSWRTHAFGSNSKTFYLLKKAGVKYISDLLGNINPYEEDNVIHVPINIPIDQNTISHDLLRPENRNPFASCTKGRIHPEEWFDILKKRIIYNEKNKINSILLIHPETMATIDNFKLFKRIAKFLSKYNSKKISEFSL